MIRKFWIMAAAFSQCPAVFEGGVRDEIRRYNMEVR